MYYSQIKTTSKFMHLCCNQAEGRWEVRTKSEKILFEGTLSECINFMED